MTQGKLTLISPCSPPALARAWMSQPHHSLPLLATASSDKSVCVYSLASFTLLSTIEGGHKRSIRSIAWKPGTKGDSVLATGSFDASAGIWRRWDNDMVPRPEKLEREFGDGNEDEEDDDEWRFAVVLDGHESEVKSVAWSAGGNFLATCSRDKSVWIWEEMEDDNFETIAVLQEHDGDVKCVVWHPEEELLASSSYDDTIRLYREDIDDWTCISILNGHTSTVWSIDFEPPSNSSLVITGNAPSACAQYLEERERSGPRLISASDDQTIRIWRRVPKRTETGQIRDNRVPSSIRTGTIEEEWIEEAQLPKAHSRAIYSVAWSKQTGKVVSTSGDGKIVVYEERWRFGNDLQSTEDHSTNTTTTNGKIDLDEGLGDAEGTQGATAVGTQVSDPFQRATEWVIVAEIESAHGVFEVNHVCWAKRFDKGRVRDDEESIVSTGDDGVVNVWALAV